MNDVIRLALLRTFPFLVVIIVIALLIKRKKLNKYDIDLQKPNSLRCYLLFTFVFLVYALLIEFSLFSVNLLEISKWSHSLYPSIILIIGAVVLAPIAEEILFRGLILNVLKKRVLNLHLSILIQAVLFVLLHNFTYQNTLSSNIGIAQSLIDGILFGYARIYTKSLVTPITMHISGNAIAIIERFIF